MKDGIHDIDESVVGGHQSSQRLIGLATNGSQYHWLTRRFNISYDPTNFYEPVVTENLNPRWVLMFEEISQGNFNAKR